MNVSTKIDEVGVSTARPSICLLNWLLNYKQFCSRMVFNSTVSSCFVSRHVVIFVENFFHYVSYFCYWYISAQVLHIERTNSCILSISIFFNL
jgi:hypothetical protein